VSTGSPSWTRPAPAATRNLAGVDLNLLVALDALLEERSVTQAAARVGVTQSAMSNTLARLRRVLGDELLVRVGRAWTLTLRAEGLREPLARALATVADEVLRPAPFDPATSRRAFRIATANAAAAILLAPLLADLTRTAPNITTQIVPIGQPGNALLTGPDIDLMLVPDYYGVSHPNRHLLTMGWCCVVADDHPVQGDAFTPETFEAYPHVLYEHDGIATTAHSALRAAELGAWAPVVVDDFVLIPFLLRGSSLVALLQDAFAEKLTTEMGLRALRPPIALPEVRIHMYWNARSTREPGHVWFRNLLVATAEAVQQGLTRG
jgi:DNA-binding transcriptional LysR family regulator